MSRTILEQEQYEWLIATGTPEIDADIIVAEGLLDDMMGDPFARPNFDGDYDAELAWERGEA